MRNSAAMRLFSCSSTSSSAQQQQLLCNSTNDSTEGKSSRNNSDSRIIDVSDLARQMRAKVREYTAIHKNVRLVGILAERDDEESSASRAAAETYSERIATTLQSDGLHYTLHRCSIKASDDSPESVQAAIHAMNHDANVHGILVFYPIFPQRIAAAAAGNSDKQRTPLLPRMLLY